MALLAEGPPELRLEHLLDKLDSHTVVRDLKELVCESLAGPAASLPPPWTLVEAGTLERLRAARFAGAATARRAAKHGDSARRKHAPRSGILERRGIHGARTGVVC